MTSKITLSAIVALVGGGAALTYEGLKRWKLFQNIHKTITSKVVSAPIGESVEIRSKVFSFPEDLTVSPLTQTKCAAYTWEIEEWKEDIKYYRPTWELCSKYNSIPYLYFSDDGKELAAVDLDQSEFIEDIQMTTVEVTDSL